ncbi:MAG: hypothetical protein CVU29_01920 [Betaproteobacteria bacterium HGW-Betaproteobacteria-22]|nr:MAG: hypothetical protein CVU29_01920 [Betaproteobacteria bacterium HGW-Betaproteobacteria-22]
MLKRNSEINGTFISLGFIHLMLLLPFVNMYHRLPILTFYAEWLAAALGMLAMLPLLIKKNTIQIPKISLIFWGLSLLLLIQLVTGVMHSTQYALLILSYLLWGGLLTILGQHLYKELGLEKLAITLAWALFIAGMINIGIFTLQIVSHTGGYISFLPNLVGYGPFSQVNHFADFVTLATASLIYLYAKGRFSLSFFILIFVCFLIMLTFSGSRSAWFYLIALSILGGITHKKMLESQPDPKSSDKLLYVSCMLLPAFTLIQIIIYYTVPSELVNLSTGRMVEAITANTNSARIQIWHDSLRLLFQSPWLGIGAGNMRYESFMLLSNPKSLSFNRMFEHSHNLFIHLLTEMGIVACLIVLIGLVAWGRAFKWHTLNLEKWWLISLLATIGIHSMLEYPLWYAYFLGIVAILLGAGDGKAFSLELGKLPIIAGQKSKQALLHVGLISALLLSAINLYTLLVANLKLESWIQNYVQENINQQSDLNWVKQHSLLAPYAQFMHAMSATINIEEIDEKVNLSESVMRFRPLRKIAYQHVMLLELQGDHANAIKYLKLTLIGHSGNLKGAMAYIPKAHQQRFLELITEVRPDLLKTINAYQHE